MQKGLSTLKPSIHLKCQQGPRNQQAEAKALLKVINTSLQLHSQLQHYHANQQAEAKCSLKLLTHHSSCTSPS